MSRIRFIILLLLVFIVGGILGFSYNYPRSFTNIKVNTPLKSSIKLYNTNNSTDYKYDANKEEATFSGDQTLRLKKGSYVAVISDSDNIYSQTQFRFTALADNYSLNINPTYNKEKLASILVSNQPQIHQTISDKYPQVFINYNITGGSLYQQGQWYGALLVPHDNAKDTYRIILEKKGDNWIIITTPPQIIIGQPDYPGIPYDVISAVDSLHS